MVGLSVLQRLRLDELEKKLSLDDVELLHDTFALHKRDEAEIQEIQEDLNHVREEMEVASDEMSDCLHDLKRTHSSAKKLCEEKEISASEFKKIVHDLGDIIDSLDDIDLRIW